ncbi:response regulator [Thermodesulfobacteriota bacterium]
MKKILVIDDEKPTLNMFQLFLSAYGYDVLTAENGTRGLEIFLKESPAIVITDIKMPGMDGFDVLRQIKEIDPRAEVIVVTGHGDMDLALEALNLNATDFINKPIDKDALDAALRRAELRVEMKQNQEKKIFLQIADDIAIMEIHQNISLPQTPTLADFFEETLKQGIKKILLVFNEASTINGAGIVLLQELLTGSERRGYTIAISGLPENFRRIFEMVGISKRTKIFTNKDEALIYINQSK